MTIFEVWKLKIEQVIFTTRLCSICGNENKYSGFSVNGNFVCKVCANTTNIEYFNGGK